MALSKQMRRMRRKYPPPEDWNDVGFLKRRLGAHKRRMRYWSGLPNFKGFGPTGKNLQAGRMDEGYELACCDALSLARLLQEKGVEVRVVDIKATFAARWGNPNAEERLLWPES